MKMLHYKMRKETQLLKVGQFTYLCLRKYIGSALCQSAESKGDSSDLINVREMDCALMYSAHDILGTI